MGGFGVFSIKGGADSWKNGIIGGDLDERCGDAFAATAFRPNLSGSQLHLRRGPPYFSRQGFSSKFLSLFLNLLSKVAPVFDPKDKSLTLELLEISDLSAGGCRTPFYSVELWRVIQQPGISLPKDFGSTEYFGKDQHCENPNPDLLSRQDRQIISFFYNL